MTDLINWISNNWQNIVAVLGAIVIAARLIVKLTPTPKDDAFLAKIIAALKQLGLVIPDEPKKKDQ